MAEIAIALLQCLVTAFNNGFICVWWNHRRREKKDLIIHIRKLISTLKEIESSKLIIDQHLEHSPSLQESKEYLNMEKNISDILTEYTTVIGKYNKIIGNQQSSSTMKLTDIETMITMLENLVSTMPGELNNIKWKRHPLKSLKLAKCSRDSAKHITLAEEVRDRLNVDNMTMKKNRLNLEKLVEDVNVLPVTNEYETIAMDFLRAEEKSIIGIHGLQGVGKTTMLKRLHNRLIDEGLQFQHVIRIDFPLEKKVDYQELQVEIMRQLSISHEATMNTNDNEEKISLFLNGKKYVLFIDQVSQKVDYGKFGLRDDQNGMNVVIASSAVKFFPENTNKEIPLKGLNEDHALTLFEKVYGKKIDEDVIAIAKRIVECCGGIPQYIKQIAANIKKSENINIWMDVKRILQSEPNSCNLLYLAGFDKMYEKIYQDIQDESAKKCLLYGALFPVQHRIYKDYLVECWIAEGFIDARDERLRSCRDRGETIVSHLTDTYLMELCSDNKYVKIQPNFRRVALELDYPDADPSKKFIIWIPSEVQPSNENYQNAGVRMSMIGSETELPEIPKGYNIYTLLLQKKANLNNFEILFFGCMPNLQVLDLYKTNIVALPKSIELLISLKGLYLNGCTSLENLPPQAAKLVMLEFLDIRSTKMSSLPKEIGSMVVLRCLRASLYTKISNPNLEGNEEVDPMALVPPNILNRLVKLEELILDSDQIDDQCWDNMAERLARELASLKYLTKPIFNFPNVITLDKLDMKRYLIPREEIALNNNTSTTLYQQIGNFFNKMKHIVSRAY